MGRLLCPPLTQRSTLRSNGRSGCSLFIAILSLKSR